MTYVAKLQSNLKHNLDVELGPLTIVIGGNETGKSAICESIALALLGEAPGLPATAKELLPYARGDGDLRIAATLDAGETATFSVGVAKGEKRPVHSSSVAASFLLAETTALFSRNEDTQREAILRAVAPANALADVAERIPVEMRGVWAASVETGRAVAGKKATEADVLVAALADLRERVRAAAAVSREAKKQGPRPEPPNPVAIEEADIRVRAFRAYAEAQRVANGARSRLVVLDEELRAAKARAEETGALSGDARALLTFVSASVFPTPDVASSLPACPACGSDPEAWAPDTAVSLRADAMRLLAEDDDKRRASLGRRSAEEIEREIDSLRRHVETATSLKDPSASGGTLADAEIALDDLRRLAAATAAWDAAQVSAARTSADAAVLKGVEKVAEASVTALLASAAQGFCDRVSAFLPNGRRATLQLFDTKSGAAAFRFGIGDVSRKPLSMGARTMLLAAVACAMSSGSGAGYRGIVIDEVAFGAAHLAALLDGLAAGVSSGAATQAIVTMIHCPIALADLAEAGWHVVSLEPSAE